MKLNITIPESQKDLNLQQFINYSMDVKDKELTEQEAKEMLLKHFYNLTEKQINQLKPDDVDKLAVAVAEVLEQQPDLQTRFKLEGKEYGMIPNLDKMSYGEYKDLLEYQKQTETLNNFMAVLFRPVVQKLGKKYRITEYDGTESTAEIMKRTPLSIYTASMLFFCDLTNELRKLTQNYIEVQIQEMKSLDKNGDSTQTYINSLRETSQNLEKSIHTTFINALPISHLKLTKPKRTESE